MVGDSGTTSKRVYGFVSSTHPRSRRRGPMVKPSMFESISTLPVYVPLCVIVRFPGPGRLLVRVGAVRRLGNA